MFMFDRKYTDMHWLLFKMCLDGLSEGLPERKDLGVLLITD